MARNGNVLDQNNKVLITHRKSKTTDRYVNELLCYSAT